MVFVLFCYSYHPETTDIQSAAYDNLATLGGGVSFQGRPKAEAIPGTFSGHVARPLTSGLEGEEF